MISPPGTSATVQGLVAGMDDGLGFAIGAFFGGFLFQSIGGKQSFKVFSVIALITCIAHIILRPASTHEIRKREEKITEKTQEMKEEEIALEDSKLT